MERRNFLNTIISASLGLGLTQCKPSASNREEKKSILQNGAFSVDDNKVTYFVDELTKPLRIIQISDTHLWMDDKRGVPFADFSKRMAGAYNSTKHFRTGATVNPVISFEETLALAVSGTADLIALTGDIFSFPSEAAIDWAIMKLGETGIPYMYIAGNHDWHYEGMEGSSQSLRDEWTKKRLSPLYQGNDPMMASYKVSGLNVVAIDNSTYEILPEQLEFFRKQAGSGLPLILMMHIPLYAPGRSMGYGCGNPGWNASSDKGYEVERRRKWPEQGHTQTTMDFVSEVFSTPDLLGVFAGHVHSQTVDVVKGIPQFVAGANATGAFLELNFRS